MKVSYLAFFIILGLALFITSCTTTSRYQKEIIEHRKLYKQSFVDNPRAPLTASDTSFLSFYPANKNMKVKAKFKPSEDTSTIFIPTYSGIQKPYQVYGSLTFTLDKKSHHFTIYFSPAFRNHPLYKNHLFLPFKDITNGEETYGGGRYIDLSISDIQKNNTVVLDFNKCYNPWCAYSDGYNCPVPPLVNHLPIAISAGEKKYTGSYKLK